MSYNSHYINSARNIWKDGHRFYWHGQRFPDRNRVNKFVETCNRLLTPTIVLGHEEDGDDQKFWATLSTGTPSYGIITKLWRDGELLKGNAGEVNPALVKAVKGKAIRSVSCEIYHDFEDQGVHYGMALRRVAFLGAEIPAVKVLAELPAPDKLGNITGIELFATGLHPTENGQHQYTVDDLDMIVSNYHRLSTCGTKVKMSERVYHVFHEARRRPKVWRSTDGRWYWKGQRVPQSPVYIIGN